MTGVGQFVDLPDLSPPAVAWVEDHVEVIDQRRLPQSLEVLELRTVEEVVAAIGTLAVRGAPTIGSTGALGLAAVLHSGLPEDLAAARARLSEASQRISAARPTAVNLSQAVRRVLAAGLGEDSPTALLSAVTETARDVLRQEIDATVAIGEHGAELLAGVGSILTHCNTGRLATPGLGTALAPIYVCHARDQRIGVIASETRPLGQGARLTTWELMRAGIDVRLIADGAGAWAIDRGMVDAVLVGADRIAANGDTANKIGTLAHACAADRYRIPFYVLAPSTTFDLQCPGGEDIEVEERGADELRRLGEAQFAPPDVPCFNPAFDVTPAELITGFITERGLLQPPFTAEHLGLEAGASRCGP